MKKLPVYHLYLILSFLISFFFSMIFVVMPFYEATVAGLTGALKIYERAGMRPARQYDNYEKELRAGKEISTQTV